MAAFRGLDRQPPAPIGDPAQDVKNMHDYLLYLTEQYNWLINLLNRREQNHE